MKDVYRFLDPDSSDMAPVGSQIPLYQISFEFNARLNVQPDNITFLNLRFHCYLGPLKQKRYQNVINGSLKN